MDVELEDRTYSFDELGDKAKEKARDTCRYGAGYLDHDWWDAVYEDAIRMGALMGLHVGTYYGTTSNGKTYSKPDIWFRGFCSQGDGCCWSGELQVADLAGAVERMKMETSDEDLLALARCCEDLFGQFAAIAAFNRLCDDDTNRDWPEVTLDMCVTVHGKERDYSTSIDDDRLPSGEAIDKDACKLVSDFASWIYDQLEAEHDHLMSDDAVDESIRNNELVFDEDGNEQ